MHGTTNETSRPKRIDSWKSIAEYLGRSSRTVQRWHRAYDLPAHRLGGESSSVYAYTDELDSWLRNRDGALRGTLIELPRPEFSRGPDQQPESLKPRRAVDLPKISDSGKERSAALVDFAYKLWQGLSYTNAKMIAQLLREAIDLDPFNAEAFAGLSHALIAGGVMGNLRIPEAYASAREALNRAIELDGELTEAKYAAAWLKMVSDRDWLGARRTLMAYWVTRFPVGALLSGEPCFTLPKDSLKKPRASCESICRIARSMPVLLPCITGVSILQESTARCWTSSKRRDVAGTRGLFWMRLRLWRVFVVKIRKSVLNA